MKIRLVLIVFLCIVLESTLLSYPLTLLSITFISIFWQEAAVLAFLAGIILDLFTLKLLGIDSLFFLSLMYLGERYRKKIHQGTFLYRFAYFTLSYLIYTLLFYKKLEIVNVVLTIFLGSLILLWLGRIFPVSDKQRLAV